jgi:hypothetical protein
MGAVCTCEMCSLQTTRRYNTDDCVRFIITAVRTLDSTDLIEALDLINLRMQLSLQTASQLYNHFGKCMLRSLDFGVHKDSKRVLCSVAHRT